MSNSRGSSVLSRVRNIQHPEAILYGLVLIELIGIASNMVRNRKYLLNLEDYFLPNITFYLRCFVVITGFYTVYRLVRYYYQTHSIDYLLIAYFIFTYAVGLQLWFIWQSHLSPLQSYFGETRDNNKWAESYPELMLVSTPYIFGLICLFIFALRSQEWDNYHSITKVIFGLFFVELILNLIRLVIIGLFRYFDHSTYWEHLLPTQWYAFLSILTLLFDGGQFVFPVFPFLLLLYVYITMEPATNSKDVRYSRYSWILFGSVGLMYAVADVLLILNAIHNFGVQPFHDLAIYAQGSLLFILILLFLLILYPEALLISKSQVLKAKKLYTLLDLRDSDKVRVRNPLDYKNKLRIYVESLPESLRVKLKSGN